MLICFCYKRVRYIRSSSPLQRSRFHPELGLRSFWCGLCTLHARVSFLWVLFSVSFLKTDSVSAVLGLLSNRMKLYKLQAVYETPDEVIQGQPEALNGSSSPLMTPDNLRHLHRLDLQLLLFHCLTPRRCPNLSRSLWPIRLTTFSFVPCFFFQKCVQICAYRDYLSLASRQLSWVTSTLCSL